MDVLIGVFGSIFAIFTFVAAWCFLGDGHYKHAAIFGFIFLTLVGILAWDYKAVQAQKATAINISCPIIVVYNTPCYKDEYGEIHEITDARRFNDPDAWEMVIKKYSSGWKYGIYVTEDRKVRMERKVLAEAQK